MYFNIYSIPVIAAGLFMMVLAIIFFKYRFLPGLKYFSLALFAGATYSYFYALEISTDQLNLVSIFYKFEYLGIPFLPAFYLAFAIKYTGKRTNLSRGTLLAILTIPALTSIIVFTNSYHGLHLSEGRIENQGYFPAFVFKAGIWYWVHQAYSIISFTLSFIFFLGMWLRSAPAFRRQVAIILIASLVPFVVYVFYLSGSFPWGLDPIPFTFALAGFIAHIGLTRFGLFKLTPIARNLLFEKIPNPVIVFDETLRIVDRNQSADKLLGIQPRVIGLPASEVLSAYPQILKLLDYNSIGEEPIITELKSNNSTFYFQSICNPLFDDNQVLRGKMLILLDVTQQRIAEMNRREIEEKFRLIFENAPIGVVYFDKNGIIKVCNDYFVRLIGSSRQEIVGLNCLTLPDKRVASAFKEAIEGKKGFFEGEYLTFTGNKNIIVKALFQPVYLQDNQIQGGFGIIEDISERKEAEKKIHRKIEELQRINAEKDRFFSIVAHDLRSPFTAFLGFTELMIEETENLSVAELRDFALQIRKSATSLFGLLENLLEWSRLKQQSISMSMEPLMLERIITNSINILEETAQKKEISIETQIDNSIQVLADEKMLSSIFRNLISNSIKFTPRVGKVNISARVTGDGMLEIKVSDNGVGISEANIRRLFRIDQKVSTPGTEEECSIGLGLILCNEFVEKHGGKIWVESQPGIGSEFYFTIPLIKETLQTISNYQDDKN